MSLAAPPDARVFAPKVIWFLWLQGLDQAPEVVRLCHESWRRRNPGWEVRALGRGDVDRYVDLDEILGPNRETASPQAISDIVRVSLLADQGGVWADATVFCTQPLDDWLGAAAAGGFFAFSAPSRDRLIASWFLASSPRNALILALRDAVRAYWSGRAFQNHRRPWLTRRLERLLGKSTGSARLWMAPAIRDRLMLRPYYWLHYLFAETVRRDPEAAAVWAGAGKRSADGPHRLQTFGMARPPDAALRAEIERAAQPMYKLDLRGAQAARGEGGALDVLLGLSGALEHGRPSPGLTPPSGD